MSDKERKKQQNQQSYYKRKLIEKCKKFHEDTGQVKISLKFRVGQNKEHKLNFEPQEKQRGSLTRGFSLFINGLKSLGIKFVEANPHVKE